MGLTLSQREVAYLLETGEAVIKIAGKDPLPLRIPKCLLEKNIRDQELAERLPAVVARFKVTPRKRPEGFNQYLLSLAGSHRFKREVREQENTEELPPIAKHLLVHIAEQPFLPLTLRYEQLQLSRRKGTQLKDELVSKGLIKEALLHLGRPGGKVMLLELTEAGSSLAGKLGVTTALQGKGGIAHKFWQYQIKGHFERQGFHAFLERWYMDVYVENGKTIAVQVAMDYRGEVEDLKKALEVADEVISACADEEIKSKLMNIAQAELAPKDLHRIQFRLVTDFLPVADTLETTDKADSTLLLEHGTEPEKN